MKTLPQWLKRSGSVLMVLCGFAVALWWWGGRESSLKTSLYLGSLFLPPSQTLEFEGVSGSLWQGGSVRQLRWNEGLLVVHAQEIQVRWDLSALHERKLSVPQLRITHLHIDDQRPASTPVAPGELLFPLRMDVAVKVQTLEWAGPPALQMESLTLRYVFDGQAHRFDVSQVQIAAGTYELHGSLQARAPMELQMSVRGSLQTTVANTQKPVSLQASATMEGALGALDSTLELRAHLVPEFGSPRKDAMQADVQASLRPWRRPWVSQAKAQWQSLDLAALWPRSPTTLLDGRGDISPGGRGWLSNLNLTNRASGPWKSQRLPMEQLSTRIALVDDEWSILSFTASAGGGTIDLTGSFKQLASWRGQATLRGINPATWDAQWTATLLDGDLKANQTKEGIAFEAQVQSRAERPGAARGMSQTGLFIRQLRAQGLWTEPILRLDEMLVDLGDARRHGDVLIDTKERSGQGKVEGYLPGTTVRMAGSLSSAAGKGDAAVQINDARLCAHWLRRFDALSGWMADLTVNGAASATAHWEGGWQGFGREMQVQTHLHAPHIEGRTGPGGSPSWSLMDLSAELSGKPTDWVLTTSGQASVGDVTWGLRAMSSAQRHTQGLWDAQVSQLEISASDKVPGERWLLQSERKIDLTWKQGLEGRALNIAGGSARLTGPTAGAVQLTWMPAQWSQQGESQVATPLRKSQWSTQGQLSQLPLEWVTHWSRNELAKQGLQGDLVLAGQWDAGSDGSALRVHAALERSRGDLQVSADEATANLNAGVREARVSLTILNQQVNAQLMWDSANAGKVQATASTALASSAGRWEWLAQAPVKGHLRAQLPRLRVWSLLAPPGWRLTGTLDAEAQLSGSWDAPHWNGVLQARELSVRSVLDGVDFSKGDLQVDFNEVGLDIARFTLQGASSGGVDGGVLSVGGNVRWPTTEESSKRPSPLRMALQAHAKGLRVSTHPDQRLVVSGKVSATLENTKLAIDGALTADQAAFVLAEGSAPRLGEDVRIRTATGPSAFTESTPQANSFLFGKTIEPTVHVALDLGPSFQIQGYGISTRLTGKLDLSSTGVLSPRLNGQISTASGSYKAYGQQLEIEEGVLWFDGPVNNPALDILAIRPNLVQRVGVQISGTALSPVVRLYSEPEIPDAEKLSWLVVGRANADGSAQMAMLQQAAMTMMSRDGQTFSSGLANSLGLDEISVGGLGTNADTANPSGATVRIGKRLAGNFYLAYESSVAGAYGTLYIFYELSKRFTLRGQTGEQSAADLIFTLRYD